MFIGSNFIRVLFEQTRCEKVINLDKQTYAGNPKNLAEFESDPRYIFCKGDICDGELVSSLLSEHQPNAVVNFAAESHDSLASATDFVKVIKRRQGLKSPAWKRLDFVRVG